MPERPLPNRLWPRLPNRGRGGIEGEGYPSDRSGARRMVAAGGCNQRDKPTRHRPIVCAWRQPRQCLL